MTNEAQARDPFDLLGLRPGATPAEIKSAYRDMAKVWHPDRFAQDPRLQQKAQERLKEINEAYRRLIAGDDSARARSTARGANEARAANEARGASDETREARTGDAPPRRARDARRDDSSYARRDDAWHAQRNETRDRARPARDDGARRRNFWPALVALAVFCATFALVTPRLLSSRAAKTQSDVAVAAAQQSQAAPSPESQQPSDEDPRQKNPRAQRQPDATPRADAAPAQEVSTQTAATPPRALPTVSVVVDPATNLLARADCPQRMRVTFPAGEEPRAYCTAEHRREDAGAASDVEKRADKSRLKSIAGRLASPSKWFSDKNSSAESVKKSAPRN